MIARAFKDTLTCDQSANTNSPPREPCQTIPRFTASQLIYVHKKKYIDIQGRSKGEGVGKKPYNTSSLKKSYEQVSSHASHAQLPPSRNRPYIKAALLLLQSNYEMQDARFQENFDNHIALSSSTQVMQPLRPRSP